MMPNQETVLKRAYLVILFSLFVLTVGIFMSLSFPSQSIAVNQRSNFTEYVALPEMLYFPSEEDPFSVSVDESLFYKVASEPVKKTEEDIIDEYIVQICEGYPNVTPGLIRSVIFQESRYNPNAKNGTHIGLMQVSQVWHKGRMEDLGVVDLYDPYGNILVGTDYLSELISSVNGDKAKALMIYNMGHKTAYKFYSKGIISSYASEILSRV